MCGKLGDDEVQSMQNMMSLAVYAVLADIFNVDIDDIAPSSELRNDLGMTTATKARLEAKIKELFDNWQIDFSKAKTVQDIVDQLVEIKTINTVKDRSE